MQQPQPKLSPKELNDLQTKMRRANELDNWVDDNDNESGKG